jgi:SAM-dependent methyltransferase
MTDWISFWNSEHSIYVNARHRDVHYRRIAEDVRRYVPTPDAVVLDYGCGDTLHADLVADAARHLILCDAAPNVRAALQARFHDVDNIEIRTPEEVAALPAATLDLIVLHSVAQYLRPAETDKLFTLFRRLLKPSGLLVVGDVVPPDVSAATDAGSLLGFAAAHGFLGAAILGLVRTVFSDYPRLRSQLGLTLYDAATLLQKLADAGFAARRAPHNIGHNRSRMTFVAKPRV